MGSPLHAVLCWRGDVELVELLLRHGADPQAAAPALVRPLLSSHSSCCRTFRRIIDATGRHNQNQPSEQVGCVLLFTPQQGQSPLHLAAAVSDEDAAAACVRTLLQAGANAHAVDKVGRPP